MTDTQKQIENEAYKWGGNAREETFIGAVKLIRFSNQVVMPLYESELQRLRAENEAAKAERDGWNRVAVDYAVALEKAEKIIAAQSSSLQALESVAIRLVEVLKWYADSANYITMEGFTRMSNGSLELRADEGIELYQTWKENKK